MRLQIATEIDLVNAALARFGGGAISDLDEDSELADVCARLYPNVLDTLLSRHDWQQLRRTVPLERLAEEPVNGWRYAFAPPLQAITQPHRLLANPRRPSDPLRDYALEGRTIYADVDALWGLYGFRLSPDQWQPALRGLVIAALGAELCVPVSEDKDMASQLRVEAFGTPQMGGQGGLFAQAIASDHAAAPAHPPLDGAAGLAGYAPIAADWYAR